MVNFDNLAILLPNFRVNSQTSTERLEDQFFLTWKHQRLTDWIVMVGLKILHSVRKVVKFLFVDCEEAVSCL